jgi:mannose-6-phosphate isomerase-like protein (cupin superfamily)
MKTTTLADKPDAMSPAGAEIRFIMDGETGNMIHSTVPSGQINKATRHKTVSEFWHVLEGRGQVWRARAGREETVGLAAGVSIVIPVGTAFQYRCDGDQPLKFICISMPPWPGDSEAEPVKGIWEPTIG